MFIYEMPPTDWFYPFKTLDQVIEDLKTELFETDVDNVREWILDEVEEAKNLFRTYTLWEGDGRVYISGLPSNNGNAAPLVLIMIKQSNNGTTFLCSPVELSHLKEYRRPKSDGGFGLDAATLRTKRLR